MRLRHRTAVIDTDNGTLLVWQRDPADSGPVDYSSFDEMLAGLHFPEDVVPPTEPAAETTPTAASDPRRPEGGYWTDQADPRRADGYRGCRGFDRADVEPSAQLSDGTFRVGLRLADGKWNVIFRSEGRPDEIVWRGTPSTRACSKVVDLTATPNGGTPNCRYRAAPAIVPPGAAPHTFGARADGAELTPQRVRDGAPDLPLGSA